MKNALNRLCEVIRQAPLGGFFGITFLFTWALLPFAATSIPISLIALCGPAVAAFFVVSIDDRESRREYLARLTHWRFPLQWFVLALTLPMVISAVRSRVEYA